MTQPSDFWDITKQNVSASKCTISINGSTDIAYTGLEVNLLPPFEKRLVSQNELRSLGIGCRRKHQVTVIEERRAEANIMHGYAD